MAELCNHLPRPAGTHSGSKWSTFPGKFFAILILLGFFTPHLCLLCHSAICCNKIQTKHFREQPLHTLKCSKPEHSLLLLTSCSAYSPILLLLLLFLLLLPHIHEELHMLSKHGEHRIPLLLPQHFY